MTNLGKVVLFIIISLTGVLLFYFAFLSHNCTVCGERATHSVNGPTGEHWFCDDHWFYPEKFDEVEIKVEKK